MSSHQERIDLKEAILSVARAKFLQGGARNVFIREIASHVNHSVGTIYLYYKNKSDLIFAIREDGFNRLMKTFDGFSALTDPVDALRKMARSYIEFVVEQPLMYDLMFTPAVPVKGKTEYANPALSVINTVHQQVRLCVYQHRFPFDDHEMATIIILGLFHGVATLHARECFRKTDLSKGVYNIYESVDRFLDVITKKI